MPISKFDRAGIDVRRGIVKLLKQTMKTILKLGLILLVAAGLGTLLFVLIFMRNSSAPFPALPTPNGYDDFLAAGNLLNGQTNYAPDMPVEPLRAFLAKNHEALRLLHLGLTRTSSVHTAEFLTNTVNIMSSDIMAIKRLAQLGLAAGLLAELEGRTNDAVTTYVAGLRYGNEVSRGGFVIHRLVGVACEAMAQSRLTIVATNLNPSEAKEIIKALEKLEAEAVSWAEIYDNERRFIRESFVQSKNPLMLVHSWWSLRTMLKKAETKNLKKIAQRRLFLIELAVRCHAGTHGNPPKQLSDLVTEQLTSVPLDPFTERAFVYHPKGTNWLLYSVGANRTDDGGPAVRQPAGDDISHDSK